MSTPCQQEKILKDLRHIFSLAEVKRSKCKYSIINYILNTLFILNPQSQINQSALIRRPSQPRHLGFRQLGTCCLPVEHFEQPWTAAYNTNFRISVTNNIFHEKFKNSPKSREFTKRKYASSRNLKDLTTKFCKTFCYGYSCIESMYIKFLVLDHISSLLLQEYNFKRSEDIN